MAAAKPRVVVPGRLWEVHAGLPMEAFWCTHGPADVTLYNFAMPSTTGARQPSIQLATATFAVWIADPDRMRLQLKATLEPQTHAHRGCRWHWCWQATQ